MDITSPPPAWFHAFFTGAQLGLFVGTVTPSSAATIAANPFLKLMLGYPPEQADADFRPFAPDRFADVRARDALLDTLTRDGAVRELLLRLRRADGSLFWAEVTGHADPAPDGLAFFAVVRDVTERKRLDDQSRELYHQLLQAEKLAALGTTISGVAHELNNPLATILTSAERLARSADGSRARSRLRDHPRRGRARGEDRPQPPDVRAQAPHDAHDGRSEPGRARHARAARLRTAPRQHRRRSTRWRRACLPCSRIRTRLQQVLLNLMINAEQAMIGANGRGLLVLRSWQDADRDVVVLELNDDGPGVPEEAMPRIFDPFFTTKEVGQGTGLGLTVAYAIVQEHGGRIRVQSSPAHGASFFLELPTAGTGVRAPAAKPAPLPHDVGGGARVLLVDDEPRLAAAVADALTDAGFRVDQAHDGEVALTKTREAEYDLVICDLRMPKLDGPSFYRAIAVSAPALSRRVIFVTGDVAGTEAGRFLEESGCRWLTKPFRLADLLRLARDVLG